MYLYTNISLSSLDITLLTITYITTVCQMLENNPRPLHPVTLLKEYLNITKYDKVLLI